MPLEHLGRQSVFRGIQTQLRRYILDHELKPGDMLPPAAEMADALGVSSASFREALRSLEALGVLEIKHGVGTFVRAYDFTPILENLSFSLLFKRDGLRELVQVREAMEVGLLPRAIECIDDESLAELQAILDQMVHSEDVVEGDRRFHRALYRCLGNELVLEFIDIFWVVYHDLTERLVVPERRQLDRWRMHAPILESIQAGQTDAAVKALCAHFDEIKERIAAIRVLAVCQPPLGKGGGLSIETRR
jgi:DNA-binding FadR family transcriptional regulator